MNIRDEYDCLQDENVTLEEVIGAFHDEKDSTKNEQVNLMQGSEILQPTIDQ